MKAIGVKVVTSLLLFATTIFSFTRNVVLAHNSPIIGILDQEQTDDVVRSLHPQTSTYIYASYVKAIEGAGGRVAPIFTGKNESYYRKIMSSINGVVIPGGNATLTPGGPYFDTASTVYQIALQFNQQGKFFPVFGVCLGFETLVLLASKDFNIQRECAISYEMLPVRFTVPPRETTLYTLLHLNQLYTLEYTNSTANIHSWCTLADDFNKNPHLDKNWKITTTSSSYEHKVEFISSMEHRQYPIFGVQFHPEVIPYEWSTTRYPRSEKIISANQYFYSTLLHYARKNNNVFVGEKGEDENDILIYNYPVSYTRYISGTKRQIYLF